MENIEENEVLEQVPKCFKCDEKGYEICAICNKPMCPSHRNYLISKIDIQNSFRIFLWNYSNISYHLCFKCANNTEKVRNFLIEKLEESANK
jgi:hypothetical protein